LKQVKAWRAITLVGLNVLVTTIVCNVVGPASVKLEHIFGLVPWAGRIPFFLLQAYIAPAILVLDPARSWRLIHGAMLGAACTAPLIFWSIATKCPVMVQMTYLLSGMVQGSLLVWLNTRWDHADLRVSAEDTSR
jgi:hypothetical protein